MPSADTQLARSPRDVRDVSTASREMARRLGPAARSLLLACPPAADVWAPRGCLALAEAIGADRPRTLLVSLEGPDGGLDPLVGVGTGKGLTDVFRGDATMREVVVRPSGRSFLYAPAGDHPAPPTSLLESRAMAHLLDRAREGGGTVLLYVGSESLRKGSWPDRLDGRIQLGDPDRARASVTLPVLARIPGPTAAAGRSSAPSSATGRDAAPPRRPGLSRPPRPPGAAPATRPALTRGLALDPEAPAAGSRPMRWWQFLVVCALAAALGLGIVWADSRDLWSRWISSDAETPAASTRR